MTETQRTILVAVVLSAAVTWAAATSDLSPVKPKQDRPVLRLLARVARLGLWVATFAEPQPAAADGLVYHAGYDEHGQRILDHGKGW
jgi:hypothetical protein